MAQAGVWMAKNAHFVILWFCSCLPNSRCCCKVSRVRQNEAMYNLPLQFPAFIIHVVHYRWQTAAYLLLTDKSWNTTPKRKPWRLFACSPRSVTSKMPNAFAAMTFVHSCCRAHNVHFWWKVFCHYCLQCSYICFVSRLLLVMSGDVEMNPGPETDRGNTVSILAAVQIIEVAQTDKLANFVYLERETKW